MACEADFTGTFDVAVVGAGPAGMAAAVAARACGAQRVCVLEREEYAGGVLPQCVHDGFGLHLYGHSLTGPEYAERWRARMEDAGVALALATCVLGVARGADGAFRVDAVGVPLGGRACVRARAVVVATGCRERTRGQLMIPGTRPSGVLTAGAAQYMVNVQNQLPGDKVVILGSGDIGLIMARRLTLEGADVRLVLGQKATGLLRNHVRCIRDFGIPIRYGWGLASVHGNGRLRGVVVAPAREDGSLDMARHEYVRCNALLIACGLIPEREVVDGLDAGPDRGLFVCGNANVPHDLADQVTQEGLRAGAAAAAFAAGAADAGVGVGADAGTDAGADAETDAGADARAGAGIAEAAGALPPDLECLARKHVAEPAGRVADALDAQVPPGTRLVACTVCPTGCIVAVDADGACTGNACERGAAYAAAELARPMRLFTGTVKVSGAALPLVAVRTSGELERARLLDVARACRRVRACAPVAAGQVLVRNVAGTGVDVVATESLPAVASGVSGGIEGDVAGTAGKAGAHAVREGGRA